MKEDRLSLGEFEELVLLAIIKLQDNAYGTTIREALETAERPTSIGALYATLDRLERKGFVKSEQGEPTQERGGRAKRFFIVEPSGKDVLRQAEAARRQLVPKLTASLR